MVADGSGLKNGGWRYREGRYGLMACDLNSQKSIFSFAQA
jgi:hypothetical protein